MTHLNTAPEIHPAGTSAPRSPEVPRAVWGRWLYIGAHVLFWSFAFVVMCPHIGQGLFVISSFLTEYYLMWYFIYGFVLNMMLVYGYAHIGQPWILRQNKPRISAYVNIGFLLAFTLAESLLDMLYVGWACEVGGCEEAMDTSLLHWLRGNVVMNFVFLLAANLYGFTYVWIKDQQTRRELEREKLQAELSALKHQINPHFLFNTLNGLYGLALRNADEETADGIAKLSHMMRYMLYESNDELTSLTQEIEYLKNYIDLQRLRLPTTVQVEMNVTGTVEGKKIAPLILMPFVENAFKHGVSLAKPSYIRIGLEATDIGLSLQVENPLFAGPPPSPLMPGGIGLPNVRQRLELLYPGAHNLDITAANGLYITSLTLKL
ncbi:MAG: histidine kinase [Bacteroidia bacterium]|nr:histidine kinase [Bacteroidia bacterium]